MLSKTLPIIFDVPTIALFEKRLLNVPNYKFKFKPDAKDAAVLVPLCLVNKKPSVLFTVRNLHMRTHRGEISFPGGKADLSDTSLEMTALRETTEEIGIASSAIDILGQYSVVPNKNGSLRVHPFVGLIRQEIDPATLNFNPDEVSSVFSLPLEYLIQPSVREIRGFRDSQHKYTIFKIPDDLPGEEREIWGLTSFIMDGIFRRILNDVYQ
ncbi:NUDIX hydrolase domain-like protein [Halteromyces radiatus]|uniref:NUDIX hydrolase domain-like protein n=1 Tax=Halteromyces radiatus TaxID=101107 RepID=UPI00221FEAAA|nr:NUDIX hydrolase domain-like protein [Halteromyces radiatus]KAI8099008.1 NUDIX hydrolase domain-like protein [Halteromyces radiatus]